MMTVRQVSRRTGVSVRTLQYYDRIGLLPAAGHTDAGYRLYDEGTLERLQQILLYRELEFPLKDIRAILSSPDFDRNKALQQQIALLQHRKTHLEKLISLAQEMHTTGGSYMDFSTFDKSKLDAYAREAKRQWGHTEPYAEFARKHSQRTDAEEQALGQGLMALFVELGRLREERPDGAAAQDIIRRLQCYITDHYYRCTDQILLGLGQMYASGGEFTENIDAASGPGTAAFAREAIEAYCAAK